MNSLLKKAFAAALISALCVPAFANAEEAPPPPPPYHDHEPPFMKRLSPEGREILKQKLEKRHEGRRQHRKEMRKLRQEMRDVITADKFDRAKFQKLQSKTHSQRKVMFEKNSNAMADAFSKMSKEDRTVMADNMRKMRKRMKRHHRECKKSHSCPWGQYKRRRD